MANQTLIRTLADRRFAGCGGHRRRRRRRSPTMRGTPVISVVGSEVELPSGLARHRQGRRHRPAARRQGRAGGRSDHRQCGRALGAARLHHRRQGRSDQRSSSSTREGRQIAGLRHCGQTRSERHPRSDPPGAAECGYPRRSAGRRRRRPVRRRRDRRPMRRPPSRLPDVCSSAGTAGMVASGDKVVNAITVRGRDQINLRVTVAEVQRDVIKQLGVDLNGTVGVGSAVLNFNNQNPFPVIRRRARCRKTSSPAPSPGSGNRINATLRAMERAGVIRTLAEPNLTAISGESANFLAGGEFPIVAGYSCDNVTAASATVTPHDPVQEIRYQPWLHSGGARGRPRQSEGHDRGLRAVDRRRAAVRHR